jgi:hypothetical protein
MFNKRQVSKRDFIKTQEITYKNGKGEKKIYWFKCLNCKKIFSVSQKRYNQGIGKFCSNKCKKKNWTGEDNPNWRGGLTAERRMLTHYQRKKVLDKRGYICENCGFDKYRECLEIHHKIPRHKNGTNNKANLIVLCANCHRYVHVTGNLP